VTLYLKSASGNEETRTETIEMGTLGLLQKALNSIGVGIVVVDQDDRIVFFNHEAGKMLNEEPEKRIGQSILLCHPKTSEKTVQKFIDDFRKDPQHR
jgi:PAS domain S-box-containing protein